MAESPNGPHNAECADASSAICVCSCRGALHGLAHRHGTPALIRRMADVTVKDGRHPDAIGQDVTNATGARISTSAARRRHPVTVTVSQTDIPDQHGGVNLGPQVTHTTSHIPADLSGVSDEDLMRHFTDAAASGSDGDAQRAWDEMGRREDAHATARATYSLPRPVHTMTDDELSQAAHDAGGDEKILRQVYAEWDFREKEAERQATVDAHNAEMHKPISAWTHDETPEDRKLDELLAKGWDYLDAYAEVHNLDPSMLQAHQAAAAVDRGTGESLDKAVRRQYDEHVHLSYVTAERAVRGHMLSREGLAEHVDPISLFSGTSARARKYASEDLLRYWADNGGRQTYTEFRAQVLGRSSDKAAAKVSALAGNGRDFV